MTIQNAEGFGRIEISNVPLPEHIRSITGSIYTASGQIILAYDTDDKPAYNFYRIAVLNDDGSGFHDVFTGIIPTPPTADEIRIMPFSDNKRALLGDFVLECTPDIVSCETSALIPIEYPTRLMEEFKPFRHWSEIIIAPDNIHMAWTSLGGKGGGSNYIGAFRREESRYVLDNVQSISTVIEFKQDPEHPGCVLPSGTMRGGEVKQFVRGGAALSLAGFTGHPLPGSVIQNLDGEGVKLINNKPGYEETTILSPDERLGIMMSARFSPKTNFAILDLLPRPYGYLTAQAMTMQVYLYAISSVRMHREGNIGPVLIDAIRASDDPSYMGIPLNDPAGEWVYRSPMSWHPSGRKVAWPEMLRGGGKDRIRIAYLADYQPSEAVAAASTPDIIPYAVEIGAVNPSVIFPSEGRIAGGHSGFLSFERHSDGDGFGGGSAKSAYDNYSDDGKVFFNGYEKMDTLPGGETQYEARLTMRGADMGDMDLRITFAPMEWGKPSSLMFDIAPDGMPRSYGFASYGGKTLRIEDMT